VINLYEDSLAKHLSENEVLTEVASFLAGFSFTAILLLYQIKGELDPSTLYWLAGSLSFSCVLFTNLALHCIFSSRGFFSAAIFVFVFFGAFISFFTSLYLMLSLINQVIATISIILAGILFILWFIATLIEEG